MSENKQTSNWINENGNPTVKWKGHSILKLREAREVAASIAGARAITLAALTAQYDAKQAVMVEEVSKLILVPAADIHLGAYSCPESPTLNCIYNIAEDPYTDCCLICGEPSERK